jgi:hypothetical protein
VRPIKLVQDEAPELDSGRWTGKTPAWIVSRDAFPWLYSDDKTAHWFRFTLHFADGTVSRLYQRTEYEPEVKAMVVEQLRQWDA